MKKLILLLFIPLVFNCSDDSNDDSNDDGIRNFLNSNVFLLEGYSNDAEGNQYPVQSFLQYNFIDGVGSSSCNATFSEAPYNIGTCNDEPWNEYISQQYSCNFYIYQENDNEIFYEMPVCGSYTNLQYLVSRNGNDITVTSLFALDDNGNPYSSTYTKTTYDYLQERKNDYNNNYSCNSDSTGDCF